jgi:hypothetical protein
VYYKFVCLGRGICRFSLPYVTLCPRYNMLAYKCVMCCFRVPVFTSRGLALCGECYLHEWMCGTGAIAVTPACISCSDEYSAAICWRGLELCVLMFCIVVTYGAEYRILQIKQYFVHLFILLARAIYMEFFKAVYISPFLGYLYIFHCVPCLVCVSPRGMCFCCIWLHIYVLCILFGTIARSDLRTAGDSP